MNKDIAPAGTGARLLDLSLWRSFADGLASLLDIPLALYDASGVLLSSSGRDNPVCSAVKSGREGRALCRDEYARAVEEAAREKKIYIYKCHAGQYFFAVPMPAAGRRGYVVIGGRFFLKGGETRALYEVMARRGLEAGALSGLAEGLKSVSPRSLFTIPSIVQNMAAPFIECLHAASASGSSGDGDKGGLNRRLRGIHALEEVHRALAPLLDREELYETILAKSVDLLEAESGSLMILDPKRNVLSVKAALGMDRVVMDSVAVKVGEGVAGAIVSRGEPVVVRDIEREAFARPSRGRYKTRSFISIPLKLEGRVIGVINITDKVSGEGFGEEDLALLQSFAGYASIAIERGAYYSMTEELKMISMTDPLTGLFNRRYFRERLYEEVERVKRHDECFSTFIIDIDNFKHFNDRFGHQAGDEILKGVSRALREAVRSMDVVARYGGEEFAVLLPHTNKSDAFEIAERIRKGVELHEAPVGDFEGAPTISLGVAEYPCDAATIEELIDKADRAMYLAKRTGKNRVVVYDAELNI
ncbi:MAG: diguanylate cyclase [Thermodesulfobacteriota bacterium]